MYDIGWDRFFTIIIQILLGVAYLHDHDPPIVHRDLKSLNVLVTDHWEIKLCDFGVARPRTAENVETLRKLRSTPAWSAPELMHEAEYTTKSDIYGLAIVMWEMTYRCVMGRYQRPFAEYKEIMYDYQILVQASTRCLRPTVPRNCPPALQTIISRSWDLKADRRPDIPEILSQLQRLQKDYDLNPGKWDKCKEIPS